MKNKFEILKDQVQQVIDAIAKNDDSTANGALLSAGELLDEILDHTDEDEDLIEISKYQVLLNQLQVKLISRSN